MRLDDFTVYRSDRAHVLCGDSLDVLPLFDSWTVDMIATDPPYGVQWQSGRRTERFAKIIGDDDASFVRAVLAEGLRVLRERRHVYVFGPLTFGELPIGGSTELIWDKGQHNAGDLQCPWGPQHERIAFGVYTSRPSNRKAGDGRLAARLRQGSVLRVPRPNSAGVKRHPTEKPVRLMRQLVDASSNAGEIVLDPFAGSGGTGVAAVLAGRRTILIEKAPGYAEMAAERVKAADVIAEQIEAVA